MDGKLLNNMQHTMLLLDHMCLSLMERIGDTCTSVCNTNIKETLQNPSGGFRLLAADMLIQSDQPHSNSPALLDPQGTHRIWTLLEHLETR